MENVDGPGDIGKARVQLFSAARRVSQKSRGLRLGRTPSLGYRRSNPKKPFLPDGSSALVRDDRRNSGPSLAISAEGDRGLGGAGPGCPFSDPKRTRAARRG